MSATVHISLSEFENIKAELSDRREIAGEFHVYTGKHPGRGYVVLIACAHHGCLMIDGPTIIAVNDGIWTDE